MTHPAPLTAERIQLEKALKAMVAALKANAADDTARALLLRDNAVQHLRLAAIAHQRDLYPPPPYPDSHPNG